MRRRRRLVAVWLGLLGLGGCVVGGASPPAESPATYGPPPGGPATIHVVDATYGASCGQPRGNVTGPLAAVCEGQSERCSYSVDYRVIGDPAYGCQKDYFAEWSCGSDPRVFQAALPPEAGFGAVVELDCPPIDRIASGAPPAGNVPPPPPPPTAPLPSPPALAPSGTGAAPIHVVAGSYGLNCRAARGNTTAHLYRSCEGQAACAYRVDHRVIGDPAYGCRKDYVAEWTCGADPQIRRATAPPEAGLGSVVPLSCP